MRKHGIPKLQEPLPLVLLSKYPLRNRECSQRLNFRRCTREVC
ncbi:hypothetical protein HMPREF3036_01966 [Sutterella sp. KLE1602]|nr:hypothetical protein HMPREF3036_01966 [Sutterella sp. KLE1602]